MVALTDPPTLATLSGLQDQLMLDSRRAGANIALNKSMTTWVTCKAETVIGQRKDGSRDLADERDQLSSRDSSRSRLTTAPRMSRVLETRQFLNEREINSLQQAWDAHVASFTVEGDGRLNVEELIIILDRLRIFDESFTPSKVRNHLNTWADGCSKEYLTSQPDGVEVIGFEEFNCLMIWAADLKCVPYDDLIDRVIRLSRKLCDHAASLQRKLEVVFDAMCKTDPHRMSHFEFANLCRSIDLPLCMGDIFLLFSQQSEGGLEKGVDYKGFIRVLQKVGHKLGFEENEVFRKFGQAVEALEFDEDTLLRIRKRLQKAAGIVGGNDWVQFFMNFDTDHSGTLDWEEFLNICRDKLHLADRDTHLKIVFERLDVEGKGEIAITAMIEFIQPRAGDN